MASPSVALAGSSVSLQVSPISGSTSTNPGASTKEARLPNQKLINNALNDVVLSILFHSSDKSDWIAFSRVCRSWRNCLNNPRYMPNFFNRAIASEYICSSFAKDNGLWTTLVKASRTSVELYLDTSMSMNQGDVNQKSVIPALSTVRKIAQNCFPYVESLDFHTFSNKVEGSHTFTNLTDLENTLGTMTFPHNSTDFDFLIPILRGSKQNFQTTQTHPYQRKIFFLSDMRDVLQDKASKLIGKMQNIPINNVELEFINVSTVENPPFMHGLATLKAKNELPPYVTFRNFETVAAAVSQKRRRDRDEDSDPKKTKTEP